MTLARFVRSAIRLAPVHFVPEVCLYQTDDIYALWLETERRLGRSGLPPPFWAVAWPGGQALARYLLDHRDAVAGRNVLDFGSGSGLVAIAAAKAGASAVVAVEPDRLARAAIELNAKATGVSVPVCVDDIRGAGRPAPADVTVDLVVAGDVWYERELADQAGGYLDKATAAGAEVLTGDIGRKFFPRQRYHCVASYEIPSSKALEGKDLVLASVWRPLKP